MKWLFLFLGLSFWLFYFFIWQIDFASAKELELPNGTIVEVDSKGNITKEKHQLWKWVEFDINGVVVVAKQLVKPAQAEELSLKDQIEAWVSFISRKYALHEAIFRGVVDCESKWTKDPYNAIKAQGDYRSETGEFMSFGIAQFWRGTFDRFALESDLEGLKYNDWKSQVELMGWAFSTDKANHWLNCWKFVRAQYK